MTRYDISQHYGSTGYSEPIPPVSATITDTAGVHDTKYTCPDKSPLLRGPSPETWLSQIKNKAIFRKLNVGIRLGRETCLKLLLAHSQLVERIGDTLSLYRE